MTGFYTTDPLGQALAWTCAGNARLTGVQLNDLTSLRSLMIEDTAVMYRGAESMHASLRVSMDDEFGWASSECPVVQWEEGPMEWAMMLASPDNNQFPLMREYLRIRGLRVEAIKSWIVSVWVDHSTVQGRGQH